MNIVQIVPRLPPATDGLGDYAFYLAKQLRSDCGINSHFIVGNPQWETRQPIEFAAERLGERSSADLIQVLQSLRGSTSAVLLHYVGYGYAKRGCPFWLIRGLNEWKRERPGRRLVTIFHELYAFGPPWTSSFWTSPFQRRIARRLAAISDRCATPMRMYARNLEKFSLTNRNRIIAMPVFSNVGEPLQVTPLGDRINQIVVFGGAARRAEIYSRHAKALVRACRLLQAEQIVDIGAPIPIEFDSPVPLIKKGKQSAEDVSLVLSKSRAGFLAYFDGYLGKSGIFAAYCAHGMLPILPSRNTSELDGIHENQQYFSLSSISQSVSEQKMQAIAANARNWYNQHSVSKAAAALVEMF